MSGSPPGSQASAPLAGTRVTHTATLLFNFLPRLSRKKLPVDTEASHFKFKFLDIFTKGDFTREIFVKILIDLAFIPVL